MSKQPDRERRQEIWEWIDGHPSLLTPGEVARMYRVSVNTVGRWADTGRLRTVRTPGGTRRFYAAEVIADVEPNNTAAVQAWRELQARLVDLTLADRGQAA